MHSSPNGRDGRDGVDNFHSQLSRNDSDFERDWTSVPLDGETESTPNGIPLFSSYHSSTPSGDIKEYQRSFNAAGDDHHQSAATSTTTQQQVPSMMMTSPSSTLVGSPMPPVVRPTSRQRRRKQRAAPSSSSSPFSPTTITAQSATTSNTPSRKTQYRYPPSASTSKQFSRRKGSGSSKSAWAKFHSRWIQPALRGPYSALLVAVALWYTLGVLSIATSKLLLTPTTRGDRFHHNPHEYYAHVGGISPTMLTVQQLLLGSTFLRLLLGQRVSNQSGAVGGILPWSSLGTSNTIKPVSDKLRDDLSSSMCTKAFKPIMVWLTGDQMADTRHARLLYLLGAAICFAVGFWTTNMAFSGTSASFVETIKAAEPITSAALAVSWGIDTISPNEASSLGSIVLGVILSTVGNSSPTSSTHSRTSKATSSSSDMWKSIYSCAIVMTANLCFSFRGLFQKLWRASSAGTSHGNDGGSTTLGASHVVVDDWNLQFRMQQIGVACILPWLFINGDLLRILRHNHAVWTNLESSQALYTILRYTVLALINGIAFTSYNLASTYLLSRISVVHHAALNCLRRIFAIVITSIIFQVPLTSVGICGIIVSVCGFLSFSYHKSQRQMLPRKVSSLLRESGSCDDLMADVDGLEKSADRLV